MKWLRSKSAYVILVVGLVVALGYSNSNEHRDVARGHRIEQRDILRNCQTGQRAYDALAATVKTAYQPGSLSVDPSKLPPATQELLVALRPLLTASAGNGDAREHEILHQLGSRPTC